MQARVAALESGFEWLTGRVQRTEDRVDRLYAQSRVFTLGTKALEEAWTALGEQADGGQMVQAGAG